MLDEARLRTPVMTLEFSPPNGTSEVRKSDLDMAMGRGKFLQQRPDVLAKL